MSSGDLQILIRAVALGASCTGAQERRNSRSGVSSGGRFRWSSVFARNIPEVRALCSTGMTRHRRSSTLSDLRLDHRLKTTLTSLLFSAADLPRLPEPPFRCALPTNATNRKAARVNCFAARAAFPKWMDGAHPHRHLRELLKLHARYGSLDRSTGQASACHEPSALPASHKVRSLATGPIENYTCETSPLTNGSQLRHHS